MTLLTEHTKQLCGYRHMKHRSRLIVTLQEPRISRSSVQDLLR